MPRLSIVIPLLDDSARFEETLASVLRERPRHTQILVPHRGDYEDPYGLAEEVEFLPLASDCSIASLWNAAVQAAAAPTVQMLAPGFLAVAGWADSALSYFAQADVAAVAPQVTEAGNRGGEAVCGVVLDNRGRRRTCIDPQLENGTYAPVFGTGFYRTEALLECGGFDEKFEPIAEMDLAWRLRRAGWHTVAALHASLQVMDRIPLSPEGFALGRSVARFGHRRSRVGENSAGIGSLVTAQLGIAWRPAAWACIAGVVYGNCESIWRRAEFPTPLSAEEPATLSLAGRDPRSQISGEAVRYRKAG